MATTKTKETKRPCVDGTQAHHTVFESPMGGLSAGACVRGCGYTVVLSDRPEVIKKLEEYGR